MINGTTQEKPEKPDRPTGIQRILEWALHQWTRSLFVRFYPELKLFDSPKQYRPAHRISLTREQLRNPLYWLFIAILFAVNWLVLWEDVAVAIRPYHLPLLVLTDIGWALAVSLKFRDVIRRDLRRQLFEQGRPICIECGYNLTGNDSGRCPECGWQVERHDGLTAGQSQ